MDINSLIERLNGTNIDKPNFFWVSDFAVAAEFSSLIISLSIFGLVVLAFAPLTWGVNFFKVNFRKLGPFVLGAKPVLRAELSSI
jgi:hypothetical protein